ncbi:MAG: WG repeat-containing protein [Clostridiales bacterium]|nr:WG repeat-containing protein [Clostridiales bacterium]
MKRAKRIMIGAVCLALLLISWVIAVTSKSAAEKQIELMEQAAALVDDGIYVRAVPLLEEAAGYSATYTMAAEEALKKAYLALIDTRGYKRKYMDLLDLQMKRDDACPEVFAEAANYYLETSKIPEALAILKTGIEKTGSECLIALYENNRYAFEMTRTSYDNVTAIYGSTVQVRQDGLWGLAGADGILLIPCEYEKISTYSVDRAIVKKDNEIYAVNIDNNRIAMLHEPVADFGNFAGDRIPLLIDGGWRRATGEFIIGATSFEQLGMYSGGYAAAKIDGKWGVVDSALGWIVPAEYDLIIQDELGRCYAQGAVFAQIRDTVYLFVDGLQVGGIYEDAKPFSNEGYAAVKKNGKWGFIDTDGTAVIGFEFDEALSFGQHLAAVKQGEYWGYVGIGGNIVIEPIFLEAKSFSNGSAPVLTERGWQFITLLEYKREVIL